ncbi:sensor histidine kinase [Microbacterium aurantiacum]|uniref:sensor histidine kinase n=1 Tax=Microbacterium aurantiacum TaxID=162393 RepID=UPI000C807E7B|nr:sensor histidine kinase [Microbacterium aurantiacum]
MTSPRSRSDSIREDEELRLPRTPGVLRRFWARHPRLADILIALFCLLGQLGPIGFVIRETPVPAPFVVAALLVAANTTLLLRRSRALVPFIAAFTAEAILLPLELGGGSPLVVVASYSIAVYVSNRAAWTSFGIGLGVLAVYATALVLSDGLTLQDGINSLLGTTVLSLIGTLIGANVGERRRYLAALIDRSRQLLVERDQQSLLAAAAERARIAREMHDIVSHSLTVIVALSEGAAATPDAERARTAAEATATTARTALSEMRAMLGVLRDDSAGASPLPLAPLQAPSPLETVSAAQRAGYPVTLSVSGAASEGSTLTHAVSRIVQEGVTNAMRHARQATRIHVRIDHAADEVSIEITNDGVSPTDGEAGFGLHGLSERVAHAGGRLEFGPTAGGGWMLRAALPAQTPDQRGNTDA